jgi:hypothetical protein
MTDKKESTTPTGREWHYVTLDYETYLTLSELEQRCHVYPSRKPSRKPIRRLSYCCPRNLAMPFALPLSFTASSRESARR